MTVSEQKKIGEADTRLSYSVLNQIQIWKLVVTCVAGGVISLRASKISVNEVALCGIRNVIVPVVPVVPAAIAELNVLAVGGEVVVPACSRE